jgi:RNA polymerase sigma-70 factor (ECF subfamily)
MEYIWVKGTRATEDNRRHNDGPPPDTGYNLDFTSVWHEYYPKLVLFVGSFFRSDMDREDAVQEILFRVFRSRRQYQRRFSPGTWIYRIARNYCIDCLRKRSRRDQIDTLFRNGDDWSSPIADPESEFLAAEARNEMRAAVNSLEPDDQQLCFLYHYEEMSVREMHLALDIPVGTIKSRLHYIRKKLRMVMEAAYAG